jgi:hypothetical protein
LLMIIFALVSGLDHSVEARPLDPITPDEMNLRLAELQAMPWAGKVSEQQDGWLSSCHRSNVTIDAGDPITGEIAPLTLTLVRPDVNKPVPVMILVPTMEGVTLVERSIASQFCDLGIATLIADVNNNQVPDLIPSWGLEDKRNRRSILSMRTTIDYAKDSTYFESSHVGLMGLSLGAITSSFMAGIEPDRLAAVVLVLAGGDLPYILSVSDNGRVSDLRQKRMDHEGIHSPAEYESILHAQMRYDPLDFAPRVMRDKLFMVLSESDTKVPTPMQKDLFAAFGKPSSTTFSTGHVQTIVGLTYFYFSYVTDFVQVKLGLKPAVRKGVTHTFVTDVSPPLLAPVNKP